MSEFDEDITHAIEDERFLDWYLNGPCGVQDRAGDHVYGTCNLAKDHHGDWHQEWRKGKLWAEWRAPR